MSSFPLYTHCTDFVVIDGSARKYKQHILTRQLDVGYHVIYWTIRE